MEASRETFESQEVIECDLCQKPVTFFCRRCWLNLCDSCVPKHLRATRKAKTIHVVVDYMCKDDHDTCFCESHPNHECSAYCKTCDCPTCILCVCIKHKSHAMSELYDKKDLIKGIPLENVRQSFRHELEAFVIDTSKKLFPLLLNIFFSIGIGIYFVYQRPFEVGRENVTAQGQEWHKPFDDYVDTKSLNISVGKLYQELEDLKKENDVAVKNQRELEEVVKTLEQKVLLATRKIVEAPSVSSVIDMGVHGGKERTFLRNMAVTNNKRVWMGDLSTELKLFDLQGNLHSTVSITCTGMYVCMYNEQVVFSDHWHNAVMKVSQDGTVVTMFETGDWKPLGITGSTSGDLLVRLVKDDQSKVVRYSSTGTVLQEIQYDSQVQSLNHLNMYITENSNGDIIVNDPEKRIVTAVDRLGIFRYSYSGKESPFSPRGVVTDSVGHVLVADFRGDKIHMLDRDGQFLTYIIPEGGINGLYALAIINDGELIIGELTTCLAKTIRFLEEKD